MNKKQSFTSAEIRSGLLVIVSIAVLAAMLLWTGKSRLFHSVQHVEILFDYISGLSKNAPVHFAGHEVGKVTDIRFSRDGSNTVVVTASVDPDVRLKTDTEAFINVLGFMGEKFIELTPGSKDSPFLGDGKPVRGEDPVALMEVVKQGTELLGEFEKISLSLQDLIGGMNSMVGENQPEIESIFTNLNRASVNLNEMTSDLKKSPWKLLRKS